MAPDYSSMWARLRRADELLNRIEAEVGAFLKTGAYKVTVHPNQDHTCYTGIIEVKNPPDIERWSLMFGDLIHNLRCALDNMVWAIAVHYDPALATSDDRVLAYPIWDKPPNSNDRGKIKALKCERVRKAIEFMQPHNRPDSSYSPYHPLSILRDLDNSNKHKLLHLTYPRLGGGRLNPVAFRAPDENNPQSALYLGQVKDGTEVFKVFFDRPHPEAKIYFQLTFVMAVVHKVASNRGTDRDDFCRLGSALIDEVVNVIGAVLATVA
jgi:hypothetical protein